MELLKGKVAFEWYGNGLTPTDPHIVFSVSKSITGILAGILVEHGQLDPDAPVVRYVPEAAGSVYGDCTVRHVLDMTVGATFHYVSPNSDMLGWILECAAGVPYARLVSDLIWQRIGAEADAHVTVDRVGAARAAGGICATLRDLARVGE